MDAGQYGTHSCRPPGNAWMKRIVLPAMPVSIYPALTDGDVTDVIQAVYKVLDNYSDNL